jgi:hypothetical protein
VAEVLSTLPPQVTALHLAGFDGAKTSLATLLVPPKAWAESLAYLAATWPDNMIEDDPERIAENLFNHIHGVVYATDDEDRRHELLAKPRPPTTARPRSRSCGRWRRRRSWKWPARSTPRAAYVTGQTTSDSDIVPLAIDLAKASEDGWERSLLELFPEYRNTPTWPTSSSGRSGRGIRIPAALHARTAVPPAQAGAVVRTQRRAAASRRSIGTDIFS